MSSRNGGPRPPPDPPQAPPIRVARIEIGDLEDMGARARQADVEFHLAQPGRYRGSLLDLETDGVGIEWGWHSMPVVAAGPVWAEGAFLGAWSGAPSRANGEELRSGLVYYPPGSEHQARTSGPMSWVSMRVADLAQLAAALAPEVEIGAGTPIRHVESAPGEVGVLFDLLRDVRRAAETGAETLRDPAARRGLRELLGAALVRIVAADRPRRSRESVAGCSALVRRAEETLRARGFQPVYLAELCAALGASEARLRQAFLRVYGIGPARHLRLRRLHLVRRALRSTRPEELTVSAAAARFGFFELGRFAGDYRALFGELPSRTQRAR